MAYRGRDAWGLLSLAAFLWAPIAGAQGEAGDGVVESEAPNNAPDQAEPNSDSSTESEAESTREASASEKSTAAAQEPPAEDRAAEDRAAEDRAAEAREVFVQAQDAFASGRFVQAARLFQDANELVPHAAMSFNAARAWQQAGELERAADAYAESIKRGELGYDQATAAADTLEELRERLGWAVLKGPKGVTVSVGYHQEVALPLETHLAPGEHAIVAVDAEGKEWTQTIVIELDRPRSAVIKPPAKKAAPPQATQPVAPPPVAREEPNAQQTWGWVAVGVGAGLGVTPAILGGATLSSKNKYEDGGATDSDLYEKTKSLRTWTNVMAFSGLAVGGTGAVLLFTVPKTEPGPTAQPEKTSLSLGLSIGGASLSGTF